VITINANGSRFAGQAPATLEDLYLVLTEHPIGDFWRKRGPASCIHVEGRTVKFWGNFDDVSHVFDVDTDEPRALALYAALDVSPDDLNYALAAHADGRWALIGLTDTGHTYAVEAP